MGDVWLNDSHRTPFPNKVSFPGAGVRTGHGSALDMKALDLGCAGSHVSLGASRGCGAGARPRVSPGQSLGASCPEDTFETSPAPSPPGPGGTQVASSSVGQGSVSEYELGSEEAGAVSRVGGLRPLQCEAQGGGHRPCGGHSLALNSCPSCQLVPTGRVASGIQGPVDEDAAAVHVARPCGSE